MTELLLRPAIRTKRKANDESAEAIPIPPPAKRASASRSWRWDSFDLHVLAKPALRPKTQYVFRSNFDDRWMPKALESIRALGDTARRGPVSLVLFGNGFGDALPPIWHSRAAQTLIAEEMPRLDSVCKLALDHCDLDSLNLLLIVDRLLPADRLSTLSLQGNRFTAIMPLLDALRGCQRLRVLDLQRNRAPFACSPPSFAEGLWLAESSLSTFRMGPIPASAVLPMLRNMVTNDVVFMDAMFQVEDRVADLLQSELTVVLRDLPFVDVLGGPLVFPPTLALRADRHARSAFRNARLVTLSNLCAYRIAAQTAGPLSNIKIIDLSSSAFGCLNRLFRHFGIVVGGLFPKERQRCTQTQTKYRI